MKKLIKFLFVGVACTIIYSGCNNMVNNDITVNYPIDVDVSDFSLTETTCSWNWQTIKGDTVYVINSAEQLLMFITCQKDDVPAIDFEKHSLLLTSGVTPSGVHSFSQHLQQISINEYNLMVKIIMNMTAMPGFWHVAILAPRLSGNPTIKLEVKQQYYP
jgi:hypothetical protein